MAKLTNEEAVREVIKAAVELAIMRHSLTDEDVEERDDFDMEFVTADTANAAFGVDTCVEEPIPEVAEILQRMAEGAAGEAAPQGDLLTTDELLVILMEECAEVIQAASKCLRFGFTREQPEYGQNDKVLAGEIGDLLGIVDALPLDKPLIEYCRKRKLEKAQKAKAQYGK